MNDAPKPVLTGGCQCGAVRYAVELDLSKAVNRCNCGICTKLGTANAIVKSGAFKLTAGEDSLSNYQKKDHPMQRSFCKVCGVPAFGRGNIPEMGGDIVGVNVNTLDDVEPLRLNYIYWDGRNNNWNAGPRSEPWPMRS